MARTYAQAVAERSRLLGLGQKLQVKLVRNPIIGDDGSPYPEQAVDDWMLQVKDPRPTAAAQTVGSRAKNVVTSVTMQTAISAGRWHGGANEHATRIFHLLPNEVRNAAAPNVHWRLFGAGEAREGGLIPNSAAIFT